jgi:quinol monooxygenase YgiN
MVIRMAYGYLGTMVAQPGLRDEVVAALVGGADALTAAGCRLYVVSVSEDDPDRIWVNEVWGSKEQHDASLALPEVKAAITATIPKLTGDFTSQELRVVGGLGVDG